VDIQSKKDIFDKLVDAAFEAARSYYHADTVAMTDAEYDTLIEQIEVLSIENPDWDTRGILSEVAAGTSSFLPTVKHKYPMLSLAKAKTIEEVESFSTRVNSPLVYEVKLDGLAVSIIYRDGNLVQLLTRGDGSSGEDITAKSILFKTLPTKIPILEEVELRGEIYMSDTDFLKTNEARVASVGKAFLNPRNAVAGIIRSLTLEYQVQISFAAYEAIFAESKFVNYSDSLAIISEWGFTNASMLTPSYDSSMAPTEILSKIEA
jgi:DNA ligase (NAD+)